MKTQDITTILKAGLNLNLNEGLIMEQDNQSIAIVKREDNKGVYFSINDKIDGKANVPYNDHCLMTLILLNKERFQHPVYKTKVSLFK